MLGADCCPCQQRLQIGMTLRHIEIKLESPLRPPHGQALSLQLELPLADEFWQLHIQGQGQCCWPMLRLVLSS